MWATQLRNYKHLTAQSSKSGLNHAPEESDNPSAQSLSDADSNVGDTSPEGSSCQTSNKNLDRCAQLLSDMLRQDPNTGHKTKAAKLASSSAPTARRAGKSNLVVKPKRINDRKTKPTPAKKHVTIKTKTGGRKENGMDTVSETSTEIQVRLTGPKPLPLNNSETVLQMTGKEPEPVPKLNSGQVIMTKVPYNDRVLCSTPMSSPNAKSRHSNQSRDLSGHHGYYRPDNLLPEPHYSLHSSTKSATHSAQPNPDLKLVENPETLKAMTDYIASSENPLSSFLKNYLSQVQQPSGGGAPSAMAQSFPAGNSQVLAELAKQRQAISQAEYPMRLGMDSGQGHNRNYIIGGSNTNTETQTFSGSQQMKTAKGSDVDIDAILRSYGVNLNAPQVPDPSVLLPGVPSESKPETMYPVTTTINPVNPQPSHTIHQPASLPQPPTTHITIPERDTDITPRVLDPPETTKTPRSKKHKNTHKDKQKKGVQTGKPVKASPGDVKTQVRTLLYLFGELRAVASMSKDREVERLLRDMESVLNTVTPDLATSAPSTEIDLAIQPLRSENAQLRRRIRILTQQFKTQCQAAEDASKPDPNFQVIHLELQRHSLETQLKEELETREKLQAAMATLAQQVQALMTERNNMLKVLGNKDTDHLRSQQDWVEEAGRVRIQLKACELGVKDKQEKLDAANNEVTLLEINLKQKNKEIERLRQLVKDLQASMSRLLEELKGNKPSPLPAMSTISHHLKNIDTLLRPEKPKESRPVQTQPNGQLEHPGGAVGDPYILPLQQLAAAIPDLTSLGQEDVSGGLERAYRLLDHIDATITPEVIPGTPSHSTPEDRTGSCEVSANTSTPSKHRGETRWKITERGERERERGSQREREGVEQRERERVQQREREGGLQRERERVQQREREGGPQREREGDLQKERGLQRERGEGLQRERGEGLQRDRGLQNGVGVRVTGFDPENDNYEGKLTQEVLLEHDRQNGVDNEVIERMLVRSTHSQRDEGVKVGRRGVAGGQGAPTIPQSATPNVTRHNTAQTKHVSSSDFDKQSGLTGVLSTADLDTTEYLTPPNKNTVEKVVVGPTVKELLAPLANRIMNTTSNQVYDDDVTSQVTSGTLSTETGYGGEGGDDDEGDSTLTLIEDDGRGPLLGAWDESRYSLTDYFKKYPRKQPEKGDTQKTNTSSGSGGKEMVREPTQTPSPEKTFDEKPFSPMSFVTTAASDSPPDLTHLSKLSFSLSSWDPSHQDSPPPLGMPNRGGLPPDEVGAPLGTSSSGGVPHGRSLGVSHGTSLGVSHGTSLGVSRGTSLGVSHGTSLGVPQGTSSGFPHGTSLGVSHGTSSGVPLGMIASEGETSQVGTVSQVGQSGGVETKSPQDCLYKGTELDTSLSTIQEADTQSVLTASSLTSLTSLSSVDEFEFKNGLAKLDANIARIQESLKLSIKSEP